MQAPVFAETRAMRLQRPGRLGLVRGETGRWAMKTLISVCCALLPSVVAAHPHIFVDTGVELIADEAGRLSQVKVTWAYDDYYSLLIAQDLGIDQDFDGQASDEDRQALTGFDMKWIEGFNGDLVLRVDGAEIALSRPIDPSADMTGGRIVTTHLRDVAGAPALAGAMVELLPYDPTYYTAYDVTLPVRVTGAEACMIETALPDIQGKLAELQDQLQMLDRDTDIAETDLPRPGAAFATRITVQCPGA
jgi:polyphosphate kinase